MEAAVPKKKESKKDRRKDGESEQGFEESPSNSREKKSRKKGDAKKKKKNKKRSSIPKEDEGSKLGHDNVAIEEDGHSAVLSSAKLRAESLSDEQGKTTSERIGYSTDETERRTNLFSEERNNNVKAASVNTYLGHVEIQGVKSTEETHNVPTLRRRATLSEMGGSFEEEEVGSQEITSTEVSGITGITQYWH